MNVFDNQQFIDGDVATDFIDKNPYLTQINRSKDRGSRALAYLADVTVNRPYGPRIEGMDPRRKLPHFPGDKADEPDRSPFDGPSLETPPSGWRDILIDKGPEGFAQTLRNHKGLAVTDTTFRDAHQSLLATRIRTRDMLAAAPAVSHLMPQLCRLKSGAGPPTTSHFVSCRKTHGIVWSVSVKKCQTSHCRCCCVVATPSDTRRTHSA